MDLGLSAHVSLLFAQAILYGAGHPQPAWAASGAQYACDSKAHSFELLSYDTDADEPLKAGFQAITSEQRLSCPLGKYTLRGKIIVGGPTCEADVSVIVRSLSIKNVELIPDSPPMNSACETDGVLLKRVRITTKDNLVTVERCELPITADEGEGQKAADIAKQSGHDDVRALIAAHAGQ